MTTKQHWESTNRESFSFTFIIFSGLGGHVWSTYIIRQLWESTDRESFTKGTLNLNLSSLACSNYFQVNTILSFNTDLIPIYWLARCIWSDPFASKEVRRCFDNPWPCMLVQIKINKKCKTSTSCIFSLNITFIEQTWDLCKVFEITFKNLATVYKFHEVITSRFIYRMPNFTASPFVQIKHIWHTFHIVWF